VSTDNEPLAEEVLTNPLDVRLDNLLIFCVWFTEIEFADLVKPLVDVNVNGTSKEVEDGK
jgi:hypothetical protein